MHINPKKQSQEAAQLMHCLYHQLSVSLHQNEIPKLSAERATRASMPRKLIILVTGSCAKIVTWKWTMTGHNMCRLVVWLKFQQANLGQGNVGTISHRDISQPTRCTWWETMPIQRERWDQSSPHTVEVAVTRLCLEL